MAFEVEMVGRARHVVDKERDILFIRMGATHERPFRLELHFAGVLEVYFYADVLPRKDAAGRSERKWIVEKAFFAKKNIEKKQEWMSILTEALEVYNFPDGDPIIIVTFEQTEWIGR